MEPQPGGDGGKCCWTWRIHWQLHLPGKTLCSYFSRPFLCKCVSVGWIWGAELGGWQKAEGLDWLACDYSGCQVFTERWWGGGETAAFTLYSKPHTYTHSHLYERLELYWKPHKPCSVYVCLCYSWPPGPVAETDRLTHIRSPPTAAECGASWLDGSLVDADWPDELRRITPRGLKVKRVQVCVSGKFLIPPWLEWYQGGPDPVPKDHDPWDFCPTS